MGYKTKIYWTLILSFIAALISLVLALPENFGLCAKNDINCLHSYIDSFNEIIQITFIFSIPIIILSFILLFHKERIFFIWSKFTIIFLPIVIILIMITPSNSGSISPFEREPVTLFLAIVFFVVSIFIIATKSSNIRRERK